MRWVIPCAGQSTRWANADQAKQLLVLTGNEPLLARTIRQIQTRGARADIVVVVRPDQYWHQMVQSWGARLAVADLQPRRFQADKLASSAHLWDHADRTNVLWGDVWWSDAALDAVTATTVSWQAMLRFGPSQFTGCDHGEFFGFTFMPQEHDRFYAAIDKTVALATAGTLRDWSGGWQLFMAAAGADDALLCSQDVSGILQQRYGHNAINIDDFTEDFDYLEDVQKWQDAYQRVGW